MSIAARRAAPPEGRVDAELRPRPDMMHGFFAHAGVLDRGAEAVALVADRVRARSACQAA